MKKYTHHDSGFITDSMISIIANPEQYDGKTVQVQGYLHLEYEDVSLYLSKDDADFLCDENALGVNFSEDGVKFVPLSMCSYTVKKLDVFRFENPIERAQVMHFNGKRVLLNGTFDAGHNYLTQVTRVLERNRLYDGEKFLGEAGPGVIQSNFGDGRFAQSVELTILILAVVAIGLCSYIYLQQAKRKV